MHNWLGLLIVLGLSSVSLAQEQHKLIRRLAVFPVSAPAQYRGIADDTWWEIRRVLTQDQRFLVASKNFLEQKDVYQARADLKPADAIILGQLLEANAVVTSFLKGSEVHLHVYESEFGRPLWKKSLQLQRSLPVSSQLQKASLRLIKDFISSIPYQGFVVKDSLQKTTVFVEEGRQYVKAQVGTSIEVNVGDVVQLIQVKSNSLQPVFMEGSTIEIFAEGKVERVDRDTITIHLLRATSTNDVSPYSLVRLPAEFNKYKAEYALKEDLKKNIDSTYFSPEMTELDQEVKENKPLITSLSFLGNLGLFLLLAF